MGGDMETHLTCNVVIVSFVITSILLTAWCFNLIRQISNKESSYKYFRDAFNDLQSELEEKKRLLPMYFKKNEELSKEIETLKKATKIDNKEFGELLSDLIVGRGL